MTPKQVVGIDPGPTSSGFVVFDGVSVVVASSQSQNELLCPLLSSGAMKDTAVVIERVQFYGKIMGPDVFDTLWWGGRFYEAALHGGHIVQRVFWNDIKRQFVTGARWDEKKGKKKAITETDVRLGVEARFGGRKAAKGTTAAPGPCAGVVGEHAWSALALAIYWWDRASSAGIVPEMADRAAVQAREFDF